MDTTPILRRATKEDLPDLARLDQLIIDYERQLTDVIRAGDDVHYREHSPLLENPAENYLIVLEVAGRVIGCGLADIQTNRHYYKEPKFGLVKMISVLPEERGKGYAKLILDDLVAWLHQKGIAQIRLTVYANNTSAIRAYEKAGFEPLLIDMILR